MDFFAKAGLNLRQPFTKDISRHSSKSDDSQEKRKSKYREPRSQKQKKEKEPSVGLLGKLMSAPPLVRKTSADKKPLAKKNTLEGKSNLKKPRFTVTELTQGMEWEAASPATRLEDDQIQEELVDSSSEPGCSDELKSGGISESQSLDSTDEDYTLSVESLDLSVDDQNQPTEQLLCRLEEGQYFGQLCFLDPYTEKRTTTMIASKDLHLIEITNKAWKKVLLANAERFYE